MAEQTLAGLAMNGGIRVSMEVRTLAIPDILVLKPTRHDDARGHFTETYTRRRMLAAGIDLDFVQDNQSFSAKTGTLRGLHFQTPPFAQAKLIYVPQGRILDVAVDMRAASPTFGKHVTQELSAENGCQLLIPVGFAHGLCTLEPNTIVTYKVTNYYSADHDFGILWNDPDLDIKWPYPAGEIELSPKDGKHPLLRDASFLF